MARPGNQDMSRRRSQFVKMTKDDFMFECDQRGFSVDVVKHKREGWNDSRQFFAVKNGVRFACGEVMKGEKNDWNNAFETVVRADIES